MDYIRFSASQPHSEHLLAQPALNRGSSNLHFPLFPVSSSQPALKSLSSYPDIHDPITWCHIIPNPLAFSHNPSISFLSHFLDPQLCGMLYNDVLLFQHETKRSVPWVDPNYFSLPSVYGEKKRWHKYFLLSLIFQALHILPLYLCWLFLTDNPWVQQLALFPFLLVLDTTDRVRDEAAVRSLVILTCAKILPLEQSSDICLWIKGFKQVSLSHSRKSILTGKILSAACLHL